MRKTDNKIVNFVLEKIKENYFLILGTNEMLDRFHDTFNIKMNTMSMDFKEQGEATITTRDFRMYNKNTNEIVEVAIVKKMDIMPIMEQITGSRGKKLDVADIIGLELEDEGNTGGVYPIMAKTDKDKKRKLKTIFKEPDRKEIEIAERIFYEYDKQEKLKIQRLKDSFIGYA